MALRAAILAMALALTPSFALASWINPGPSDAELETIVRAAYSAASAYAKTQVNYFARDGEFEPLHTAVVSALAGQGLVATVPMEPFGDLAASRKCLAQPGTELRVSINSLGDGLGLAAVTNRRVFTYHYDPHEDAAIIVVVARDCAKS
ncbi:MAG: hypothetical protein ABIQ30_07245 [Devosia sp.]